MKRLMAALLATVGLVGGVLSAAAPVQAATSQGGHLAVSAAATQLVKGSGCNSYPYTVSLAGDPAVPNWTLDIEVFRPGYGPNDLAYATGGTLTTQKLAENAHLCDPYVAGIYNVKATLTFRDSNFKPVGSETATAVTVLQRPSAISLNARPSCLRHGSTFTLSGTVVDQDQGLVRSAYVQLWFERAGTSSYVYVGYRWTNSLGVYSMSRTAVAGYSGNWKATWAGNATAFRSASPPRWVSVV